MQLRPHHGRRLTRFAQRIPIKVIDAASVLGLNRILVCLLLLENLIRRLVGSSLNGRQYTAAT